MTPSKLSQSILGKISTQKIKPRPKWHFVLKNTSFWLIFIGSILLGALGFGLILTVSSAVGIEEILNLPRSPIDFLIRTIPIIWIIIFLFFLCGALWGFHHTKKGYKISFRNLLVGNILISAILGIGLHSTQIAERIEIRIARSVTFYEGAEDRKKRLWHNPSEGRLTGLIIETNSRNYWTIKTPDGIKGVSLENIRKIHPSLEKGKLIRVIGTIKNENIFEAEKLLPWKKPRK